MNCEETASLLNALLDNELDAGHARDVEAHVKSCSRCGAQWNDYRTMRQVMSAGNLAFEAPASLRSRVEAALPQPIARLPNRRTLLKGFALGATISALAAVGATVMVFRVDQKQHILEEIVSAHLRSLQAGHLTDIQTSDQHTIRPWFNGRLDVAPFVVDLTAQGFTLVGGRLDVIDGTAVGAIVYRRRRHVINLFIRQTKLAGPLAFKSELVSGFNVRHWAASGLEYWAISDLDSEELREFEEKIRSAVGSS
jgi:anti-sigma factor RsiW